MTFASKSETFTADNGARVEVGTVTFQGRDFAALGSVVDEAHGVINAYVSERDAPGYVGGKRYVLTTWDGAEIASLRLTGSWLNRNVFGGYPVRMFAWSATIGERVYSGRNTGAGMFVRMRGRR